MKCRRARLLLGGSGPRSRALREHLAGCEACADYVERLDAVHRALGQHHASVSAPAGFVARVRSRLRRDDDPIGWAALRLLPATLGLIVLLSWLNLRGAEPATDEITDPTTAMLSWVLDSSAAEQQLGEDGG